MFRASVYPSSGVQCSELPHMVCSTGIAGCGRIVEKQLSQSAHNWHDGHIDARIGHQYAHHQLNMIRAARNMLS
jgi:hypothetical protein